MVIVSMEIKIFIYLHLSVTEIGISPSEIQMPRRFWTKIEHLVLLWYRVVCMILKSCVSWVIALYSSCSLLWNTNRILLVSFKV